jgi:hypothetical protein
MLVQTFHAPFPALAACMDADGLTLRTRTGVRSHPALAFIWLPYLVAFIWLPLSGCLYRRTDNALSAGDRDALIEHATEIRVRAEIRAGELPIDMAERRERAKAAITRGSRGAQLSPLSDLGVTKTQSSRWQRLAGDRMTNRRG